MMEVDWEVDSYPSATDFKLLPLFALFFLAARFFLDTFVFEHLARWLILGKEHVRVDIKEAHDTEKKIKKFKESAWKCIYFLSAEILALSVSYGEPWFTDSQYFWKGPGDQIWPDQKMKLTLKGLYMYVAGFYTYALFALVFWETRRSDFWVSMMHHLATLPLLLMAYLFRFGRVGAIVLALHDASDVFLEVGKMSKYSGYDQIANVAFPLFVLSFTLFRIICFPVWVLRSTSYEILLTLNVEKHKVEGPLFYYAFNTLLFCLLILNLYWWVLMCRMLVRQIQERGQISDDVRSDSEGEDDHQD